MGMIADVLNSKNDDTDKDMAIESLLKKNTHLVVDVSDLQAAINYKRYTLVEGVCRGLRDQTPKVLIPEELIAQTMNNFVHAGQENHVKIIKDVLNAIVDSGSPITINTMKSILKGFVANKRELYDNVLDAILKTTKKVAMDLVVVCLDYLKTYPVSERKYARDDLIYKFLESGGEVTDEFRSLVKAHDINDLDDKIAFLTQQRNRAEKAKAHSKHATKKAPVSADPSERKDDSKPKDDKPSGLKLW